MRTPQNARTNDGASPRRIVIASLISIPVAAEVVLSEVLFVGHIVFLVEALGFALGLAAFILIWAALGIAVLAARDSVWPRTALLLDRLRAGFSRRLSDLLGRAGVKALLVGLGVPGVLAAAAIVIALAGSEIEDWAGDHRADIVTFLVAAAVIFPIVLVIARLGRRLEKWVRGVADTAGPAMRAFAALVSMILLGPALSWLLFRLLRYSSRSVYALTLVSAPVFGAVWVPFYALGVWGLVEGLV